MQELLRQLESILRGMWRFRWPGLIVAWIAGIIGVVIVFKIPDQYEASARIFVDTQSILKPLMAGLTIQPNVQQQVQMLSRTLVSRPNVEKLVRMADMDLRATTKGEQEELIDRLMRTIVIRNTNRDNLYTLAFKDSDQEKAKRVVQSLVSIFVESSLGASRKDTDSAKTFLTEQIKQYEAKLEEAEARLKEFRIRNIDMQTPDGRDSAARAGEVARQLQQAKLELREAENAREAAKKQLADAKAGLLSGGATAATSSLLSGLGRGGDPSDAAIATPEVDARIAALTRNLDSLLQRYTDQHPDVVQIRRQIKDLEEQKRKEVVELKRRAAEAAAAAASAPSTNAAADASPVVQEVSRLLAAAELQVASLQARVGEFTARFQAAKENMKFAPQVEAEAAQLNRDYGIIKKNYEDLVSRRQAAIMSGELDVASGVADFRLIDPPRVTPKPVSPNRLALLPVALLVAVAAGLGIAFLGSQLRPVFSDGHDLRVKTGLPVLGVVSASLTPDEQRAERRGLIRFFGATAALVSLFAVGVTFVAVFGSQIG